MAWSFCLANTRCFTPPQKFNVEHNIVTRLRRLGLTMQEAVNKVGVMLDDCYEQWRQGLQGLPSDLDQDTANHVSKLLEGYRNVAIGTLYWR